VLTRLSITILAYVVLALTGAFPTVGQASGILAKRHTPAVSSQTKLTVVESKLQSSLLAREVSYRVIVPADYKRKRSERYPVIYLLHGLYGHFSNWTDMTDIATYAANYRFIIVMPEGNDGWWTDSVTVPTDRYESYIIRELIPEIDKAYRTIADRDHRFIAGLSMGGYGAIKFGLKYPDMFSLVGSFSGALDAPLRDQDGSKLWATLLPPYGPLGSTTRQGNDIFGLLRNIPSDRMKALPFIYLDCGTEDMFITTNRDFDALLLQKKLPHEFRELPGKHEWPYWNQQVQEFLRVAGRKLAAGINKS
jgi:S-formylglutathione hydrolase FrmB